MRYTAPASSLLYMIERSRRSRGPTGFLQDPHEVGVCVGVAGVQEQREVVFRREGEQAGKVSELGFL
jgi:hypothetical protein